MIESDIMSVLSRWKSESGQMAIFVALIFQVLFVFFAMVINISMIVHDKIVLQNSVDLAAYYAAQKQAEVLNQMGHINYQIRQANKLLAWRQWVLGDLGYEQHPLRGGPLLPLPPLEDQRDVGITPDPDTGEVLAPGICITHFDWEGTISSSPDPAIATNMCRDRSLSLPKLPVFSSTLPLIGDLALLGDLKTLTEGLAEAAAQNCRWLGPINWGFAAKVQLSYRMDLYVRKRMFKELANQISQSSEDFRDIRGDSVLGGVEKVVQKNVNQNQEPPTVELFNPLAVGACSDGGFVQDIVVNPLVTYADFDNTAGCKREDKFVACGDDSCMPRYGHEHPQFVGAGENVYHYLQVKPSDLPEAQRPSMGYEKNPWCMAYVGVEATMTSRKPFGPFGQPVILKAKGFAKPFGGTTGPWYSDQWGPGQPHSHGAVKVDNVGPPRDLPGVSVSHGGVANYSRYPGDVFGYSSRMERGALRGVFLGAGKFGEGGIPLTRDYYDHIDHQDYIEATGNLLADTLTDEKTTSPSFRLRQIEMAAVAPDIYDVTYYPVEPEYFKNYLKIQRERNLFQNVSPISDLGSHLQLPDFESASVALQVIMTSRNPTGDTKPYTDEVFYKVRDHGQMLSWWLPRGLVDYGPPGAKFMSCPGVISGDTAQPGIPGMCYDGGRVGHSVKLVHRNYLTSEEHQLGGNDAARGALANPPGGKW